MAKEFKISALRLKELEQELFYLKTTREKEVAEQIKEARSFGDLSENSEYDEAKNEQAKLYGRIAEVENILAHAVIIDETEDSEGKISLGCTIKVDGYGDRRRGALRHRRLAGGQPHGVPHLRRLSVRQGAARP